MFISLRPPLNNFGSQGQDLHVILVAELTGDGSKDTSAAGVLVLTDEDCGILVKADIGTVGATNTLVGTDDNCLNDFALLNGAAGGCLADRGNDNVADVAVLALGAAKYADAFDFFGAGLSATFR
jgi:hypothetical protein